MFTLRSAQWSSLQDERLLALVPEIEEYLRQHHADAVAGLSPAMMRARVELGARRAASWGLDTVFGFGLFTALMIILGPEFDTDPQIRAVLGVDAGRPEDRLAALEIALDDEDWAAVADCTDPDAWET